MHFSIHVSSNAAANLSIEGLRPGSLASMRMIRWAIQAKRSGQRTAIDSGKRSMTLSSSSEGLQSTKGWRPTSIS